MTQNDLHQSRIWLKYIGLFAISMIIIVNICLSQVEMDSDLKSESSLLTLQLTADESSRTDYKTDVTLKRAVTGDNGKLKFKYDIDVPPIDDFYFVLALDSSGSLGAMGDPSQAEAVMDAVPRFINDTIIKYPNKTFNMSVVSWDNETDFISPQQIKLTPIQDVSDDINNILKEYCCEESDITDLSQPLRASTTILDENKPRDYRNNMKFVLIVVSAGEHIKCDPELINRARDNNYNIYIVGMGFETVDGEKPEMLRHLEYICGDENRITTCESEGEDLKDELLKHLNNALSTAINEPAADNVILTESFYDHIYPDEYASVETLGVPGTLKYVKGTNISGETVDFQLPELLQDNVTEIIFEANISIMNFPIFRTEYSNSSLFNFNRENTPPNLKPGLSYRWLMNNSFNFSIELPANNIVIESYPLTPVTPNNAGVLSSSNMPKEETSGLGSGLGLITLIILLITAVILMQKA